MARCVNRLFRLEIASVTNCDKFVSALLRLCHGGGQDALCSPSRMRNLEAETS